MNLVQALYLNNDQAPFDDVRVRQALCYAIDRDAILELTADGHGTKLGSSMYPAFTKYFDDSLTLVDARLLAFVKKGQAAADNDGEDKPPPLAPQRAGAGPDDAEPVDVFGLLLTDGGIGRVLMGHGCLLGDCDNE